MSEIGVECRRGASGWSCTVTVTDRGTSRSFDVGVSEDELERFDPAAAEPGDLVRGSFEFLLEREPKESILSSFGLSVIERYFPEYEQEIRRRSG